MLPSNLSSVRSPAVHLCFVRVYNLFPVYSSVTVFFCPRKSFFLVNQLKEWFFIFFMESSFRDLMRDVTDEYPMRYPGECKNFWACFASAKKPLLTLKTSTFFSKVRYHTRSSTMGSLTIGIIMVLHANNLRSRKFCGFDKIFSCFSGFYK